ncbi:MAG: chemotaxis protein [Alphaproteobacteria bacterium]|nr:chemotaxis protein [Alphaproteobacteria bacterium]
MSWWFPPMRTRATRFCGPARFSFSMPKRSPHVRAMRRRPFLSDPPNGARDMETSLNRLRRNAAKFVIGLLWLHPAGILAFALLTGGALWPVGLAVAAALVPTVAWRRSALSPSARLLASVGYVAMVSLLLYQSSGMRMQIDVHMYYFAALAILAAFCDWRTILAAAAATAVHHLVLNSVYPAAVFPAGADFLRVVLHAVIVVGETAALVWLTLTMERASAVQDANLAKAEAAAAEAERLRGTQADDRAQVDARRSAELQSVAGTLEAGVGGIAKSLSEASDAMQAAADRMARNADDTRERASAVSDASREASENVQAVASATQELSASIGEIARQVSGTTAAADQAAESSRAASDLIQRLDVSAQRIGEVVSLINGIASQTNLLALNATIEAARAGEAGKGFAVVASEVKTLANQTGKATDDIAAQVGEIQAETGRVVEAIARISEVAATIRGQVSSIAAAMEQQGAATAEIARNVEAVAATTRRVSENIDGVGKTASETGTASGAVRESARGIAGQSQALAGQIQSFLSKLRAG